MMSWPSFSLLQRMVGTQRRGGKVYFICGLLLMIFGGPVVFLLPFSTIAFLFALAFMATLNFSSLSTVTCTKDLAFLQLANVGVLTISTAFAFRGFGLSSEFRSLVIALLFGVLIWPSHRSLPRGLMKRCVPVQQLVFAATLISWMLVRESNVAHGLKVTSWGHFEMALRSLFLGPLGMFAVVFVSGFAGWSRYLILLAGACLGQYAIGLLELSIRLDVSFLRFASLISACGFVLLLVAAVAPRRAKRGMQS